MIPEMDGRIGGVVNGGEKLGASPRDDFRVIALISTYNEGDIISEVLRHLIEDGVSVYLIDNRSSDDTVREARRWLGRGLIEIETYPKTAQSTAGSEEFRWEELLLRKEELANTLDADWFLHQDADEIRQAPWPVSLADAIRWADQLGYNCIDFAAIDFPPVDNGFRQGMDPATYFSYCEEGRWFNRFQRKCWKATGQRVMLANSGGHDVQFSERRIFPIRFILRHYPVRSQHHGMRKVLVERRQRYLRSERERGWHIQYDNVEDAEHSFLADRQSLEPFVLEQTRLRLLLNAAEEEADAASLLPATGEGEYGGPRDRR